MKSIIFKGLFVFSVGLNLAVIGVVAWKWSQRSKMFPIGSDGSALSRYEARQIKHKWWAVMGEDMGTDREKVAAKYSEIIDMIASSPNVPNAFTEELDELIKLRGAMERRAILNLRRVFRELPPDKRQAFAGFLKRRTCFGHRPGSGRGHKGKRRGCPAF